MKRLTEEKIVCSAVWFKDLEMVMDVPYSNRNPINIKTGLVFGGLRHHHCLYTMVAVTGKRAIESEVGEMVQGFLTTHLRFVDRIEGAQIHINNGGTLRFSDTQLFSEDLY